MFEETELLLPDPILGLSRLFREDPRPDKIDLGVGVFRTSEGRTPIMNAVAEAERTVISSQHTKAYTPPEGAPGFVENILELVFGAESAPLRAKRLTAIQAPGGCGALRLAAELLKRNKARAITVGVPTWANHFPLLSAAGLKIETAPYYDSETGKIEFDAFFDAAKKLGPKDVLLLHGACHNPTGADLTREQIDMIGALAAQRRFLPMIDMAYHGFAESLETDAYMIRSFAEGLPELLVTYSCSKNFGLYRERVVALAMMGENASRTQALKSHAENIARTMYSMPPAHGGAIVAQILQSPELTMLWKNELSQMANALRANRRRFVEAASQSGLGERLSYIGKQAGIFSLLPLSIEQVSALREKYAIYVVSGGRINVCGVNETNALKIAQAFKEVTGG